MAIYPFIEAWVTGDKSEHHILDRPRNAPTRTAFGVAAMTWYAHAVDRRRQRPGRHPVPRVAELGDLLPAGGGLRRPGDRVPAHQADLHRAAARRRRAAAARRGDAASSSGIRPVEYSERHRPITEDEAYTLTQHVEHAGAAAARPTPTACRRRRSRPSSDAAQATRFFFIDTLRKPTRAELEEAAHHHDDGHGDGHEVDGRQTATATGTARHSDRGRRGSQTLQTNQLHHRDHRRLAPPVGASVVVRRHGLDPTRAGCTRGRSAGRGDVGLLTPTGRS